MANGGNLGRLARLLGNTFDLPLPDIVRVPVRSLERNQLEADGDEPRGDNFVQQELGLRHRIDHRVGVDRL